MVSDRLKDIIFKKLYKELSKVEIISYKDSVYFIDRDNKYWYFEYENEGKLWWRYDFFKSFFVLFSLESPDFDKVMSEWVEEVLNCKVNTTLVINRARALVVEEVLNCKVNTTRCGYFNGDCQVEEVLNCKVTTTVVGWAYSRQLKVEEVLNCKVNTTSCAYLEDIEGVEEVLAHKDDVTI
jgi:hypothetical protein